MQLSEEAKNELKKPLGSLHANFKDVEQFAKKYKIISVGDVCTLNMLSLGLVPHLAVFDHYFMRHKLEDEKVRELAKKLAKPKIYKNPPGTLSERIIEDAENLIKKGGAIFIEGEEDLTALAFILAAENEIVIYGQPNEGVVIVRPNQRIKNKIKRILASSSFSHKV